MNNLKNLLKELEKNGRNQKIYLNIVYYLCKSYKYCKSLSNLTYSDLELLYDNLYINNELIDSDNVEQYDLNKLGISAKNQQALKEGKKILLLNYYKLGDNWPVDCKIWLDPVYDKLIY